MANTMAVAIGRSNYQEILEKLEIFAESPCARVLLKFLEEPRTMAEIHAHLDHHKQAWMKKMDDLVNENAK
jgi:hypothetical protein